MPPYDPDLDCCYLPICQDGDADQNISSYRHDYNNTEEDPDNGRFPRSVLALKLNDRGGQVNRRWQPITAHVYLQGETRHCCNTNSKRVLVSMSIGKAVSPELAVYLRAHYQLDPAWSLPVLHDIPRREVFHSGFFYL